MNKISFAKSMSNMKGIDVTEKIAPGFLNTRRYVTELLHDYCIFFFSLITSLKYEILGL